MAVLVVVGSIPPGGLFFLFLLANLLFWGAQRPLWLGILVESKKTIVWDPLIGRSWIPQRQKPRSWRGKPPVLRACSLGTRGGVFFWRTSRFEPPDVT
jgi:hypothetical protein